MRWNKKKKRRKHATAATEYKIKYMHINQVRMVGWNLILLADKGWHFQNYNMHLNYKNNDAFFQKHHHQKIDQIKTNTHEEFAVYPNWKRKTKQK